MKPLTSLSIFGLGKLGACMAATLAARGFKVVGVDIDPEKVRRLNEGLAPVEEPRLLETIAQGQGRLRATLDVREALDTEASVFIPPSPSLPDGSFSNEFLLKSMQPVARVVKEAGKKGHLFIIKSATTPGSIRSVLIPMLEKETGWLCGRDFSVCYNPEFIALGNVIDGLLAPDLVLIGESDPASGAALEALYQKYNRNQPRIARMSITSAELAKISVNSFITMKISFTNQLRLVAERLADTNIHDILAAIGADSRIGQKYLRAGLSYGGPCIPRDNRLVAFVARQVGLEAPLALASDQINELTKLELVAQVSRMVNKGDTVAVLGLAYKPDTYITEESAGLFLAQKLKRSGIRVLVHDFASTPENSPALHEFECLEHLDSLANLKELKVAVLCCLWPPYQTLQFPSHTKVLDPWGMLR